MNICNLFCLCPHLAPNKHEKLTPDHPLILGLYHLFHGKFHRGTKRFQILEALLASVFMLEKSAMHSDLNLCITISVCGSATLYSGSIKLRLSIGIGAGAHSAPHIPIITTTPLAKGSVGTQHIASMLRPPLQRNPKCGLWYWNKLEWLQQRQQMHLILRRGLVLWLPDSACATVGQVYLGCKGKRKKPDKLATIACFTMSKAFKLIFHLWYA